MNLVATIQDVYWKDLDHFQKSKHPYLDPLFLIFNVFVINLFCCSICRSPSHRTFPYSAFLFSIACNWNVECQHIVCDQPQYLQFYVVIVQKRRRAFISLSPPPSSSFPIEIPVCLFSKYYWRLTSIDKMSIFVVLVFLPLQLVTFNLSRNYSFIHFCNVKNSLV